METRSCSRKATATGPTQLIPFAAASGLANKACSSEAQEKFLQLMGLTAVSVNIQTENIFEDLEADLIAMALSHSAMLPDHVNDPHFTPREWSLYQKDFFQLAAQDLYVQRSAQN